VVTHHPPGVPGTSHLVQRTLFHKVALFYTTRVEFLTGRSPRPFNDQQQLEVERFLERRE